MEEGDWWNIRREEGKRTKQDSMNRARKATFFFFFFFFFRDGETAFCFPFTVYFVDPRSVPPTNDDQMHDPNPTTSRIKKRYRQVCRERERAGHTLINER